MADRQEKGRDRDADDSDAMRGWIEQPTARRLEDDDTRVTPGITTPDIPVVNSKADKLQRMGVTPPSTDSTSPAPGSPPIPREPNASAGDPYVQRWVDRLRDQRKEPEPGATPTRDEVAGQTAPPPPEKETGAARITNIRPERQSGEDDPTAPFDRQAVIDDAGPKGMTG